MVLGMTRLLLGMAGDNFIDKYIHNTLFKWGNPLLVKTWCQFVTCNDEMCIQGIKLI